jgi:TonB family protein
LTSRVAAAVVLLLSLGAPALASAQPATPEAPAKVEAPKLVRDPGVAYPAAALDAGVRDTVRVVLILELDEAGRVTSAAAENPGDARFDDVAIFAAKKLEFAPARRGATPVRARIRYVYTFTPPPPPAPAEADTDTPARDPAPPANEPRKPAAEAAAAPVEILVIGEKLAPAVKSFSQEEVREMPGAFGDPFRAIEAMPGVTPIVSGLPFFYVRGAPPGNVGYFLDGIRVPYLYHVGLGPSVIHPGMVERVDLYSGGYPASFGRFAGGIVSAETKQPRTDFHGEGNVRLFDAGALAETGFGGDRGTILLGARYSYTAAVLSLVVPEIELDYRDYQLRATWQLTERDRLTLFGFGAYDLLAETERNETTVLFGTEFYRVDLRHAHALEHGSIDTHLTFGFDQTHIEEQGNVRARSLGVESAVRHRLSDAATARVGVDAELDVYDSRRPSYFDPDDPELDSFAELYPTRNDTTAGMFADVTLRLDRQVELTPGIRVDGYLSGDDSAVAVEPRVAARFLIGDRFRLIHAHGIAHQPPAFVIPLPGLEPSGLDGGLQTTYQTSAGAEFDFDADTSASLTLFQNVFLDMTDAIGVGGRGDDGDILSQRSLGRGVGVELFARRKLTRKLGGFVAYTLSRSTRSVGRESFPSNFDRTHVFNAALGYDLGANWRAGGRVVFYTGTPVQSGFDDDFDGAAGPAPLRSGSPERSDPFFRLDLRLEKRFRLGEQSFIAIVIEMLNATLSKESFGDEEIGPVTIPSLGVEARF